MLQHDMFNKYNNIMYRAYYFMNEKKKGFFIDLKVLFSAKQRLRMDILSTQEFKTGNCLN